MKKKILSVVLSLAMAVSMCACGAGKGSENKDSGEMAEVTLGSPPCFVCWRDWIFRQQERLSWMTGQ